MVAAHKRVNSFAAVALIALLAGCNSGGSRGTALAGQGKVKAGPRFSAGYPNDWRVTVQRALAGTNFPVLIPTHPLANAQNVTAAYLYPQGVAIVLQFPPAEVPAQPVLQDFIELFEAPWESGEPMTDYLTDIREDPAVGKDIFQIGDVPALGVTAHSPSAADRSNAAFLRFVLGGVEIQLSGGESIDKLLDIAKTIVAASVTPSPKASEAPSQNPSPAQPLAPSESPSPTGSPTT